MCTVTYLKSGGKTILTSNRDEQTLRPSALAPQKYNVSQKELLFPKDPQAGGTWFAVDESANVMVLLNGAAQKHRHEPPYRKSRGLVVLDLMGQASPLVNWKETDLENIEPFTLVLLEAGKLHQLRWNGSEKETLALDAEQPHIWSSATLYPEEIRREREHWFQAFLAANPQPTESEMCAFHSNTHSADPQNGLVINRGGQLKTLSITQAVVRDDKVVMTYRDLVREQQTANSFSTA